MKTIDLNTLGFMGIKAFVGYTHQDGDWVAGYKTLTPLQARKRAVRTLKNAAKCADGRPIWRYDSTNGTFILQNPASPCFSLALSAVALGFAGEVLTNDRYQFDF